MNLKKLKDSLLKLKDGWVYHSYKYESKLFLEEGGVRPIVGQVGKSKDGITYKLMKIVPAISNEGSYNPDDVQEVLKYDWDKIKNVNVMFDDLLEKFKYVLSIKAREWSNFYNDDQLSLTLRTIKSSSSLASAFCESVPDRILIDKILFRIKFGKDSFQKGKNPEFDREAYKQFLMTKANNPMSEEEAEKSSYVSQHQWETALAKARSENTDVSLSRHINPQRRNLIQYVKDFIIKSDKFVYDSMIDVVVDDFTTTGISLRKMVEATKIQDGTAIGVALFTK